MKINKNYFKDKRFSATTRWKTDVDREGNAIWSISSVIAIMRKLPGIKPIMG